MNRKINKSNLYPLSISIENFISQLQCAICLCTYENPASLPCNHCFCEKCIHRALEMKPQCPICKTSVTKRKLRYDSMLPQLLLAADTLSSGCLDKSNFIAPSPILRRQPKRQATTRNNIPIEQQFQQIQVPSVQQSSPTCRTLKDDTIDNKYQVNQIVEILDRTWPGINKLGGTAWITQCYDDNTYDVKFVIDSRKEFHVPDEFIVLPDSNVVSETTPSGSAKKRKRQSRSKTLEHPIALGQDSLRSDILAQADGRFGNSTPTMVFLCSGFSENTMKKILEWAKVLKNAAFVNDWSNEVTHLIVKCIREKSTDNGIEYDTEDDEYNDNNYIIIDESSDDEQIEVASSNRSYRQSRYNRKLFNDNQKSRWWVKIRSLKYLKALVSGRWIVSEEWLHACFRAGGHISEHNFEAAGYCKAQDIHNAVKNSRLRREDALKQINSNKIHASNVGTALFSNYCFHLAGDFLPPMPPQREIEELLILGSGRIIHFVDDIPLIMGKEENENRQLVIVCDKINPLALRRAAKEWRSLPELLALEDNFIVSYQWVLNSIGDAKLRSFTEEELKVNFMSNAKLIESLLGDSDDDDLGEFDLSNITLEDILREEELASGDSNPIEKLNGNSKELDLDYVPATFTLSITPVPGMEVVASKANGSNIQSKLPIPVELDDPGNDTDKEGGTNDTLKSNTKQRPVTKSPLEIAEAREDLLLSCIGVELISPLQVKRRLRANARKKSISGKKSPVKSIVNKKKSTGGVTSTLEKDKGNERKSGKQLGVVKVQAMETISRQLRKNIEFKEHGPGSPTVVAIHSKFIAIGTSKGLVIVFDHFQNIRQILGNTNDNDVDGPITAIDVSPGSDFLASGYQSGRIVLWDMIKGTSLKAVSDAHENPVVGLRFVKYQKPVLLSVDTNGVVNKLTFSKVMGMVYIVDVDPIYDGSVGRILSISVLPQLVGTSKMSYITDQYCLTALSSEKVTFIVAIEPEVRVLYRWNRPEDIKQQDPVLPSLAFAWVAIPGNSRATAPILSRSWGKRVQFLEVVFPGGPQHSHNKHGWPTFEERDQVECTCDVMAIQWLGEQVIVYLTAEDEICVYDVMSRQELETVDVSSLELVFASYRGKNARSFSNSFRGCDNILYLLGLKELQTAQVQPWTQRIDTLVDEGEWLEALALALDHYEGLKIAATERAVRDQFPPVFFRDKNNDQCLVNILQMCQTNQRTGEKEDVFRHEDGADEVRWTCGEEQYPPEIAKKLEETLQKARSGQTDVKAFVPISITERVADLLMEYVRLAIANAPTASDGSSLVPQSKVRLDLAKSHYQMLAGVCIEFCAIIGRTDLLFGEIFTRFKEAKKLDVLVELLEPYILSDKLRSLSTEALEEFVRYFSEKDKLPQVEQCLLHLDVSDLDINSIVKLCKEHEMYSALVYVYNKGLNDYVTPIDILLEASTTEKEAPVKLLRKRSSGAERQVSGKISSLASAFGGTAQRTASSRSLSRANSSIAPAAASKDDNNPLYGPRRRRFLGYKLLLYISRCLQGKTFPQKDMIPQVLLGKVRAQVSSHLFQKNVEGSSIPYSLLMTLVDLDVKEFLNIIAHLLDDPNVDFEGERVGDRHSTRYDSARNAELSKCPSRLSMVLALAEVVCGQGGPTDLSRSKFGSVEHSHFFMFKARLLSGGSINAQEYADANGSGMSANNLIMDSIMNFLALGPASLSSGRSHTHSAAQEAGFDKAGREAMLVKLLQKLNPKSYSQNSLLQNVLRERMNRAAVILYKQMHDFSRTIGSYLDDLDLEFRMNAFTFIRVETDKSLHDDDDHRQTTTSTSRAEEFVYPMQDIEDAVLAHAAALMETDHRAFVVLILGQFTSLNNRVIQKFLSMGKTGTKLEFQYLNELLKGSTNKTDGSDDSDVMKELLDRSKLRLADDPAVQERFIRLLCEYEPKSVFPYLESNDSYKVDACLQLCKEFNITDAEAYLLERTGDTNGALTLILKSLEQKLKILKPALRGFNTNSKSDTQGGSSITVLHQQDSSIIESVQEGKDAMATLEVALAMCQRNSLRNRDEQAEKLWFTLLDKLLKIQNTIKKHATKSSSRGITTTRGGGSSGQSAFQIALNELIRIVLERMASSVSLMSILFKITNEHGKGEFGDFRQTIFGMLDTYNYEQNIYQTANGLISSDLYEQLVTLRRSQAKSYAPSSNTCSYCNVLLSKPPFGMTLDGKEKWNLNTSMVMIVSRQTFHESCGKAWQQGVELNAKTLVKNAPEDKSNNPAADAEGTDDTANRLEKKQPSTRRYLYRLKNARRAKPRQVSPHVVLESLVREDTARNKYLKGSRSVFSLKPDSEQGKVKKRVGTRKPGSLPLAPIQKGGI